MTHEEIFDSFLERGSISVPHPTRKNADSMRITLIQRYRKYKSELDSVGYLAPCHVGTGVSMKYKDGVATYSRVAARVVRTDYEILGVTDAPQTESLREAVETDSYDAYWNSRDDAVSLHDGVAVDSGSEEREDDGSSSPSQDRGANFWEALQQDRAMSQASRLSDNPLLD